ncbi:hypothetical protein JOC77_001083 [Peribacillus deserti]|uniref:Uncharacterized protein n=1 Tax=Peribacillus deserti TaxID=673318 RepID=A0ABS2QHB9_9BACI|nr:hypothetical protein [Peribacillus deserti]
MGNERKSLWKALIHNGFLVAVSVLLYGIIVLIYILI